MSLEQRVQNALIQKGWTLSLAESCTGGLLAARLVAIADCSKYFLGSLVAYSNEAKQTLLEVPVLALQTEGAVSTTCALAMAQGAKHRFGSTCAAAITGIAGPSGGTADKPVGTVCFALVGPQCEQSWSVQLQGEREAIMQHASDEMLNKIWDYVSTAR